MFTTMFLCIMRTTVLFQRITHAIHIPNNSAKSNAYRLTGRCKVLIRNSSRSSRRHPSSIIRNIIFRTNSSNKSIPIIILTELRVSRSLRTINTNAELCNINLDIRESICGADLKRLKLLTLSLYCLLQFLDLGSYLTNLLATKVIVLHTDPRHHT